MKHWLPVCMTGMAAVWAVGCASIVGKSVYPVNFSSEPTGAKVTVIDRHGVTVCSGNTPMQVSLKAGAGYWSGADYTATFESPGHGIVRLQVHRGVSGWYVGGNLLFGGLVGWLIVDPATGAMWTLEPNVYALLPKQNAALSRSTDLRIVSVGDVPGEIRDRMVRVN